MHNIGTGISRFLTNSAGGGANTPMATKKTGTKKTTKKKPKK